MARTAPRAACTRMRRVVHRFSGAECSGQRGGGDGDAGSTRLGLGPAGSMAESSGKRAASPRAPWPLPDKRRPLFAAPPPDRTAPLVPPDEACAVALTARLRRTPVPHTSPSGGGGPLLRPFAPAPPPLAPVRARPGSPPCGRDLRCTGLSGAQGPTVFTGTTDPRSTAANQRHSPRKPPPAPQCP